MTESTEPPQTPDGARSSVPHRFKGGNWDWLLGLASASAAEVSHLGRLISFRPTRCAAGAVAVFFEDYNVQYRLAFFDGIHHARFFQGQQITGDPGVLLGSQAAPRQVDSYARQVG